MRAFAERLRVLPSATRCAVIGALLAGVPGALAGLVVGLAVHPATAWFAVFELGVPAAALGTLLGLIVALGARVARSLGGRRGSERAQ